MFLVLFYGYEFGIVFGWYVWVSISDVGKYEGCVGRFWGVNWFVWVKDINGSLDVVREWGSDDELGFDGFCKGDVFLEVLGLILV